VHASPRRDAPPRRPHPARGLRPRERLVGLHRRRHRVGAAGGRTCGGARPSCLNPAVWERFEASLWSTTSLLVSTESESLVVDPAITSDEVARISQRAIELGAPVRHVLIT